LGELIHEGQRKGVIASKETFNGNRFVECETREHSTLEDIGITRKQSSTFQQIASIPKETFETLVSCSVVTKCTRAEHFKVKGGHLENIGSRYTEVLDSASVEPSKLSDYGLNKKIINTLIPNRKKLQKIFLQVVLLILKRVCLLSRQQQKFLNFSQ
jgi:hypothetical protein